MSDSNQRYTREEGRYGSYISDNQTGEALDLYDILKVLNAAPFSAAELKIAKRLVNFCNFVWEADAGGYDFWDKIRDFAGRQIQERPDCGNHDRMMVALFLTGLGDFASFIPEVNSIEQARALVIETIEHVYEDPAAKERLWQCGYSANEIESIKCEVNTPKEARIDD